MEEKKLVLALTLVFTTFLGAVGQLFFKLGVASNATYLLAAYVVIGLISYAISTIFYLYILSRAHLSWAYSFGGLSYLFTAILAFLILHETVSKLRWLGVFIIFVGVALIGLS